MDDPGYFKYTFGSTLGLWSRILDVQLRRIIPIEQLAGKILAEAQRLEKLGESLEESWCAPYLEMGSNIFMWEGYETEHSDVFLTVTAAYNCTRYINRLRSRHPDLDYRKRVSASYKIANSNRQLETLGVLRDVMEHYDDYSIGGGRRTEQYIGNENDPTAGRGLGVDFNEFGQIRFGWRDNEIEVVSTAHTVLHIANMTLRELWRSSV